MKRAFLSVMMMLGLIFTPTVGAVAQPGADETSFTSQLTGDEVDLGFSGQINFLPDDYDYSTAGTFAEEYIWFTYGWSNFEIVLIQGAVETSEYHELTVTNMVEFYDSFDVIDENITNGYSWFLGEADYQGTPLVVYYEFQLDVFGDVDLVVMQFTDAEALADELAFVQGEVTIAGDPILPDTDPQDLGALLDVETPSNAATVEADNLSTPKVDEGDLGGLKDKINRTERTVSGDATSTPATTDVDEATAVSGESSPEAEVDWESAGLVSDSEWVSPYYGATIKWDTAAWVFPREFEYAIVLSDDPYYDLITLETVDGLGYTYITIQDVGEITPRGLVSYWNSPEYADTLSTDIIILETSTSRNGASVVYETVNSREQPLVVVISATFLDDGTLAYTEVSAAPETIATVYAQFVDGVTLNGDPFALTYTVEDIEEISGN